MTRRAVLGWLLAPAASPGRSVFEAVNRERVRRRGKALVWNEELAEAARLHSESMARNGFFSHVDAKRGDLSARLERAGIRYSACAENIYTQTGRRDAVDAACAAWMKSAGHRANILSPAYRESGVGMAVSQAGRYYLTQIFLR